MYILNFQKCSVYNYAHNANGRHTHTQCLYCYTRLTCTDSDRVTICVSSGENLASTIQARECVLHVATTDFVVMSYI